MDVTATRSRGKRPHVADLAAGAAAGVAATGLMSAVMVVAKQAGLLGQQPPERIAEAGLDAANVARSEGAQDALATVLHFGFGAVGGAGYRIVRRIVPKPRSWLVPGVAYGLAIWLVSYKGWIPRLGILPPPARDRPGRPTVMIAAHVVYGVVLGRLAEPRR